MEYIDCKKMNYTWHGKPIIVCDEVNFTTSVDEKPEARVVCNSTETNQLGEYIRWLERKDLFTPYTISIKKVIFNDPATIVFWNDGTKTVVKCGEHDEFDREKGLAMAICKKTMGNKGSYYNTFKKWIGDEEV